MSNPIRVKHPGPIRFVPRGGRAERAGYLTLETPVALPEADAGAFEPAGPLPPGAVRTPAGGWTSGERALYVRDGSLWTDLHGTAGPMARSDLEGFLAAPEAPAPGDATDLLPFFHQTPVMAGIPRSEYVGTRQSRGTGPEGVRDIRVDGSDRARADLVRFLERDVAIVRDTVRVRLRSPCLRMTWTRETGAQERVGSWTSDVAIFPNLGIHLPNVGSIGDPAGFAEAASRLGIIRDASQDPVRTASPEGIAARLGLDPSLAVDLGRGAVARLFANNCHEALHALTVAGEAVRLRGRGEPPPGFEPALGRSRAWMALGSLSAVRDEEVERCLADARGLALLMQAMHGRAARSTSIKRLLAGIEALAVPDLPSRTASAPEEDLGSLSALAR